MKGFDGIVAWLLLLALTTHVSAQGFGTFGGNTPSGDPFSHGGDSGNGNGDGDGFGVFNLSRSTAVITAHAVLACLCFVVLLPLGGILIRLGSFEGVWRVHAVLQIFAYLVYFAAFVIGAWMLSQPFASLSDPHPVIGIVLFVALLFQPLSGIVHHTLFKKHQRRVLWSQAHIWIGRIAITLGMINGGLGLRYGRKMPIATPSTAAIIGYGVGAGLVWLLYVISIFLGEKRRSRARQSATPVAAQSYGRDKPQYR